MAQSNEASLGQRNPACGSPEVLDDGMVNASPDSVSLDGTRLCSIAARLKEMQADVHSVVIVHHGKLVFEQYFPGYDEPWGQGGSPHEFEASTKQQAIGYFSGLFFYGQQWWLGRSFAEGSEVKWIAAMGSGGQRIFVVPDRDLVITTTSGLYFQPRQGDGALDMLTNFILPSVRDK